MSNSYFQFKQFTVNQEKSAMKVCTDACVFGAYISLKEKDFADDKTNILDIGTGTGLLSLMIAQKVKGSIEAVEIDNTAFEQARENFIKSAWSARLTVSHADVTKFAFQKKYDIIVSNPPFFEKSLKSSDYQKNLAKHATFLSYAELASVVLGNLANKGKFYVLLPYKKFDLFQKTAIGNKLYLLQKVNIRQSEHAGYFRTAGIFSNVTEQSAIEESITIKDQMNSYTEDFIQLLKDYYLYL